MSNDFDLTADPFDTGFAANEDVKTADFIKFLERREAHTPAKSNDMHFWAATAKAALEAGFIKTPTDWTVAGVASWPPAKTRWLAEWAWAFYRDKTTVPFEKGSE